MSKSQSITFRVGEHEKKRIISKSHQGKVSISDFCRYASLGKEIKRIDGLKELNFKLNKIGNNINQMTLLMHQKQIDNPDLFSISKQLLQLFDQVVECLNGGEDYSNT